jgi:hypothetical protein
MPENYVFLGKETVGSTGAASVTFNSLPTTGYTDLVIKISGRSARVSQADNLFITFNAVTTGYTVKTLTGNGTSVTSASYTARYAANSVDAASSTSSTFSSHEIYIPNYRSANFKSYLVDSVSENNASDAQMDVIAGLWSNTAAITSITLTPEVSTWVQHSTFTLYGVTTTSVTPTIAPFATGGDVIDNDGTYFYHAFRSSSTFTPLRTLSCDVLIVAGGGGGSTGGGGAGGVLSYSAQSFATAKTITIGGGGAGYPTPSNGSVSSVTGLTSPVGGGQAAHSTTVAQVGGSGGGGYGNSTYQAGAAGTSGQGFAGGNGQVEGSVYGQVGGGGGGAGGAGTNATNAVPATSGGAGGVGTNSYSTWLNTTGTGVSGFIAGGGGGVANGAGGSGGGGGGAGSTYTGNGQAGTVNTGGGGGAFGGGANSGGGSGLVIIRYPMV